MGKSGFRNLLSKGQTDFTSEKSVLRVDSNREIQIRMSWISFLPFHWEIRKRICKTILVNMGLLFANNPKSGFSNLNDDFPMERTLNLTFLKKFLLQPLNNSGFQRGQRSQSRIRTLFSFISRIMYLISIIAENYL